MIISVNYEKTFKLKIKRSSSFSEIRKTFCQDLKIGISSIRFLIDGRRISDNEKVGTLNLTENDIIEAYKEISGGGGPRKKIISPEEVTKILDSIQDDDNSGLDSNSSEFSEHDEEIQVMQDKIFSGDEKNLKDLLTNKNDSSEQTSSKENHVSNEGFLEEEKDNTISEGSVDTMCWLQSLRDQYKRGELTTKNHLHRKIIYYLQLPKLEPIDIKILKNVLEMRAKHEEWEAERDQLDLELNKIDNKIDKMQIKKRKIGKVETQRRLRSKTSKSSDETTETELESAQAKSKDTPETKQHKIHDRRTSSQDEVFIRPDDFQDMNPLDTGLPQTPKQRYHLFKKFGMSTPSPLRKQTKVSKEEMKMFSFAVHLWAERQSGGVSILHRIRLTDKHFREILSFAGTGSRWNLLKSRSILQYKSMWRNMSKGRHSYNGHPETGFETETRVHDSSSQFCPFRHCQSGIMSQLDIDIILLTPKRKSKSEMNRRDELKTNANRKLFNSNACTDKQTDSDNNSAESSTIDFEKEIQAKAMNENDPTPLDNNLQVENTMIPSQSPTKDELKRQNKLLLQKINLMSKRDLQNDVNEEEVENQHDKTNIPISIRCNLENCDKSFTSTFGLNNHQRKVHGEDNIKKKTFQICSVCGKNVIWIDHHMKTVHKEVKSFCEICQKKILGDMKKHRGLCIFCPFCGYKNEKKNRLLKHVHQCHKRREVTNTQNEPLDLTSPRKEQNKNLYDTVSPVLNQGKEVDLLMTVPESDGTGENKSESDILNPKTSEEIEDAVDLSKTIPKALTNKKRTKYPFDEQHGDEFYVSEFEENDEEIYTTERRMIKDEIETKLRDIDALQNSELEGDEIITSQFRLFMQQKKSGTGKEGKFTKLKEVSTIGMYTRAVQNEILPAFHRLFSPFDSRWILDCTTEKECTFEGEQRSFVSLEEPTYMSSKIIEEALKKYDNNIQESGNQRATILGAARDFMDFIELQFNRKINLYGPEPLKKVMSYHKIVRTFISATGIWKICNDGKQKTLHDNKVMEDYKNPNKDIEILEKYQNYIKSPERIADINKILKFSSEAESIPTDGEMTEMGRVIMGEVVMSTGCRPVVIRHLTCGSYADKKPGFDPKKVTPGDCVIDEEQGKNKIYRRVNPNLPPKDKACKHQLEQKTAECPVFCDDRCEPEGFNVYVTWDKTQGTKGPSYLHISKPLKVLMDLYDIVRSKFFKGRRPSQTNTDDDWLHDDDTPFFLNSACSSFNFLDLKHISEAMGIDVTAYSFRRIISTWALSHESEDIREAEEEALQHQLKVARDHYLQNKQMKPQKLTQTYVTEEGIFPSFLRDQISEKETSNQVNIKKAQDKRAKRRFETLSKEKQSYKQMQAELRPLGPRHRILETDKKKFTEIVEEISGNKIETSLTDMKPLRWRNYIIRLLCTAKGTKGEELRSLWIKVYRGDLKWGVRDARLKAKEKNWPKKDTSQSQDRNSWISSSLRTALLTKMQGLKNVKKNDKEPI